MAVVGLIKEKTFPVYDQTVTVEFWRPGPFDADPETFRLRLKWRGFKNLAHYQANGAKSFYEPATINFVFQLTALTWPFAPGVNLATALFTLIKTRTQTVDNEGNELNGGIDWSTATDATV